MPAYQLKVDASRLQVLIDRTHWPIHNPHVVNILGQAVRKHGVMVQARAVRNVGGWPVTYNGRVFIVRPRTGTLKSSIELQWPYGSTFTARVYVNGAYTTPAPGAGGFIGKPQPVSEYASAIEDGHKPIDLKLTMLGKTIPFFAARSANARGPYAATGLSPVDPTEKGYGSRWESQKLNARLAAKGKGPMIFTKQGGKAGYQGSSSSYYISFRRVGRKGWIVPEAKPRPFMRAAAEGTREQARLMYVKAGMEILTT
jgi:hypothetical protein